MIWESYNRPPKDEYEALFRDAVRRVVMHVLNQTPAGARVSFYESHDYDIKAPLQPSGYLYNNGYNDDWEI